MKQNKEKQREREQWPEMSGQERQSEMREMREKINFAEAPGEKAPEKERLTVHRI